MQADLRIPFPCPLVIRGASNLPQGHELVGMFAYQMVSGHWWVHTGVAGIGEEGVVTTAGLIALAAVTGWENWKAEWVDVAWLAMHVHVERMRRKGGGVAVIDVEGEAPPPLAAPGSGKPPPPPANTGPPASKAAHTSTPAERAAHERTRGDVAEWVEQQQQQHETWQVGAISAEAAQRDLEARLAKANEDTRAAEGSVTPFAATRSTSVPS